MKKTKISLWLQFDRVLASNLLKQAVVLACLFVVLFIISFALLSVSFGEWQQFCDDRQLPKLLLPLYLLIDTNALNGLYMTTEKAVDGWLLFASSITYLFGLFVFNGMIISLMTNAISARVKRHNEGLIRYVRSGHYIVMGYDDMCPSVIDSIFARDDGAYILLLTSAEPQRIRERLRKNLGRKQLDRIIINYGHRMSCEEYGAIHLEAAEEIFIVGNRSLPAHDAVNVECVDNICTYLEGVKSEKRPSRITCVFEDLDTYAAFKKTEIFDRVGRLDIELVPYNFYAGWANQVFVKQCHRSRLSGREIAYPSVCGDGIRPQDDKYVHLVFVGTTNFAVAFAMEAAHVLHFPNYGRDKSLRTRITFIDLNADRERHIFTTRNRHFFDVQSLVYRDSDSQATQQETAPKDDFLDVEFEFIKGDVFSDTIRGELAGWAADPRQHLSVFLAMANQRDNFAIGMNMPDEIYDCGVPIFIRQDRSDNFVTNLREVDAGKSFVYATCAGDGAGPTVANRKGRYANIYPFGMNDTGYSDDETMMLRAKLINYLYHTADYSTNLFTVAAEPDLRPATVREVRAEADRAWHGISVANRWSNIYAACSIACKLVTLRAMRGLKADDCSMDARPLSRDEIDTLAGVEHNRWNVEKLLMGFRRPRPEEDAYLHPEFAEQLRKNTKLFIHHDIRPYEELPEKTKQLDREFSKYIPWILTMSEAVGKVSK